MKALISKPKAETNAAEVAKAGGSANLVHVANGGKQNAITPDNPGDLGGLLRFKLPPKAAIMTDSQVGALKAAQMQIATGAKNAVAGYGLIRKISDDLTKVKEAHDQTVAHQATNDCKQLASQHKVAEVLSELRFPYMQMNHGVTSRQQQADGAVAALEKFDRVAADLMMAV